MKKLTALLLTLLLILSLTACDLMKSPAKTEPPTQLSEDIITTMDELDLLIAQMCEQLLPSAKIRLESINIWRELENHIKIEEELLIKRGIVGLSISYVEMAGFIEATLNIEYEVYMKVTAAYKSKNTSSLNAQEKAVYDKAVEIIDTLNLTRGTIFEKAFAVHEYLANTIEYDYAYAFNADSFDVYGALITGKAVCQGYAYSFKMLMDMLNVECIIISGTAGNEKHAWNMVNYNGKWYHVDVTWNDQGENRTYRYFNISDTVMSSTHSWNRANFPTASEMTYNYYGYTGRNASSVMQLETVFQNDYNSGMRVIEILCTYSFTPDDLQFIITKHNITPSYGTTQYGNDVLVTIVL
ncbi:MAG: hypothetical protein FWD34_06970 [Oscillospiraceae bacterium]|nr:hypothetical protein [Oscillospiraceae bacterium]